MAGTAFACELTSALRAVSGSSGRLEVPRYPRLGHAYDEFVDHGRVVVTRPRKRNGGGLTDTAILVLQGLPDNALMRLVSGAGDQPRQHRFFAATSPSWRSSPRGISAWSGEASNTVRIAESRIAYPTI